jgi:RNA polymerase sigma-B factor
MHQSALLRDWEWLQEQVIPPLIDGHERRPPEVWSIGSLEDAIAITAAYADSAGAPHPDLRTYVSDWSPPAGSVSFGCSDMGRIPVDSRSAWFTRRERRWVAQPTISDRVILGEPTGLVDLVTLRDAPDHDSPDPVDHDVAEARLRQGGYLLVVEPPKDLPDGFRLVDEEGRLYEKVGPHRDETTVSGRPVDRAESLARQQRQHDLVDQHINLARALARRFLHRGEPVDDLEQVAFLALVKAARRFEPERQAAFSTYATVSILGELKRHFRDKTWMLRVPRSAQELYLSIKDAREELGHVLGRSPTLDEIASHLGVSVDNVLEAMEAGGTYWPSSLDVYGADGERAIDVPDVDNSLESAADREQLRALLPRLSDRERLILKRIYFDGDTQQRVAGEIGASQMQVSRLLARTLDKLRQWCNEDRGVAGPAGGDCVTA